MNVGVRLASKQIEEFLFRGRGDVSWSWEPLEKSSRCGAGVAVLEEVLELGEQDVLDLGQLESIPRSLRDQPSSIPDQQPKTVSRARRPSEEAFGLAMAIALVEKTGNQAGVKCVGLGLFSNGKSPAFMKCPVLEPAHAVAMSFKECDQGFRAPAAGGLAADSKLIRPSFKRLEPFQHLRETGAVGRHPSRAGAFPGAVLHSLLANADDYVVVPASVDSDIERGAGRLRAATVFSQGWRVDLFPNGLHV